LAKTGGKSSWGLINTIMNKRQTCRKK
jgi:hypothetical protein